MTARTASLILLLTAVTLLASTTLGAANIQDLQVTHDDGSYSVAFDVIIGAEPALARQLLGDYTQWPRLSKALKESELLETFPDGRQRLRLRFHSCVLIFCKTILQIKDMEKRPNGDLLTIIVPEDSDFAAGWERWEIRSEHDHTRVRYHAELVPDFSLPPLIGPWILKMKLRRRLTVTAERLEALGAE
ncbi:MAG: SRPBCC family protein [Acidiferrobacterales bacterium]